MATLKSFEYTSNPLRARTLVDFDVSELCYFMGGNSLFAPILFYALKTLLPSIQMSIITENCIALDNALARKEFLVDEQVVGEG